MKKNLLLLIGALTLAAPALGLAQDAGNNAQSPAPALRYESAFAGYKAYEELAPADWRALNDAVGRATQKEDDPADGVSTPAATSGKPPLPSSPSGKDAHGAHGAHGGMK